jgi:hypothetical protein
VQRIENLCAAFTASKLERQLSCRAQACAHAVLAAYNSGWGVMSAAPSPGTYAPGLDWSQLTADRKMFHSTITSMQEHGNEQQPLRSGQERLSRQTLASTRVRHGLGITVRHSVLDQKVLVRRHGVVEAVGVGGALGSRELRSAAGGANPIAHSQLTVATPFPEPEPLALRGGPEATTGSFSL